MQYDHSWLASNSQVPGATETKLDRHHGWHTELNSETDVMFRKGRRTTDYVVRSSFVTETKQNPLTDSPDRRRMSITLRFRSLLNRRSSMQPDPEKIYKTTYSLDAPSVNAVRQGISATPTVKNKIDPILLKSNRTYGLKRAHSDACLKKSICNHYLGTLRVINSEAPLRDNYSTSVSSASDNTSHDAQPGQPEGSQRKLSLSTGNICCLYALHCLPSVEFTHTSLNCPSPATTHRRASLPTTSALKTSNVSVGFPFSMLKRHPCYQDANKRLGEWVRKTLAGGQSKFNRASLESVCEEKDKPLVHPLDWNDKHVRFADEATCSSSTLNSLSASSSTRSLSSLSPTLFISSLKDSCQNLGKTTMAEGDNVPELSSRPSFSSRLSPSNVNSSLNESPSEQTDVLPSRGFSLIQPLTLARHLWKRKRMKSQKTKKDVTPLVTVNVIQNYSEPPEVPNYVLRQLSLDKQPRRYWKAMFVNPCSFENFHDNLMKNGICLAQMWSTNLQRINVEVHVLSTTSNNAPPSEVKLRYTLDDWKTNRESSSLDRVQCHREKMSTYDFHWVEIYEGSVNLDFPPSNGMDIFAKYFEFAVVARKDSAERWDNNDKINYVCQTYIAGGEFDSFLQG